MDENTHKSAVRVPRLGFTTMHDSTATRVGLEKSDLFDMVKLLLGGVCSLHTLTNMSLLPPVSLTAEIRTVTTGALFDRTATIVKPIKNSSLRFCIPSFSHTSILLSELSSS